MKHFKSFFLTALLVVLLQACKTDDTIRVLCIGNSFSWDAVEQELAPLCEAGDQPSLLRWLLVGATPYFSASGYWGIPFSIH